MGRLIHNFGCAIEIINTSWYITSDGKVETFPEEGKTITWEKKKPQVCLIVKGQWLHVHYLPYKKRVNFDGPKMKIKRSGLVVYCICGKRIKIIIIRINVHVALLKIRAVATYEADEANSSGNFFASNLPRVKFSPQICLSLASGKFSPQICLNHASVVFSTSYLPHKMCFYNLKIC